MGKKRKLRKAMRKRGIADSPALAICVGKRCCERSRSRALVDELRTYAAVSHPDVQIAVVGCLHVCKNGPVAATYPRIKFKKHVDAKRGRKLVDKLASR
jgi:(2Fe-2S) ferredoxin